MPRVITGLIVLRSDRPSPERWLETAREVPGSWWSDWSAWLRSHAGTQVRARTRLGSTAFPEIEPAPGRYVTMRAA